MNHFRNSSWGFFKFHLSLFWVFMLCLTSQTLLAQSVEKEIYEIETSLVKSIHIKGETIEKFSIEDRMQAYKVPGLSIAVVKEGEIRWTKSYGLADANRKTVVDENTLFQAASISKPITALAILKLAQEQMVDLDANVNLYLKGWQIEDNEFTTKEKVSLRRLLTHTAGLNGHGFDGYLQDEDIPTTIEILNGEGNSRRVIVENTPGAEWRYSGMGYVILQKVVEDVTGIPFADFMQTEILMPLGMKHSTYKHQINVEPDFNISSAHDLDGAVIEGRWHNFPEMGPGGLWTTASDFAQYCISIQNILSGKSSSFLSKESVASIFTKTQHDWGLGPLIQGENETLRFTHDGHNTGYITEYLAFAHKGEAVIIMTNGEYGRGLVQEILMSVSSYYDWDTHHQRVIVPPMLSAEELNKFVGEYRWIDRPNYIIEVIMNEGQLRFVAPGFPVDNLTPYQTHDFIDIETEVEVHFQSSKEGQINGAIWRDCNLEKIN
ncbi:MAG: serine hydrolase domain-containing protein [Bacteroidia bacterium]